LWTTAVPGHLFETGSADASADNMIAGMKDMLDVMDKFLGMGMSLDTVVRWSTWHPAREIQHEELGHVSAGAPADITVLRLEAGHHRVMRPYARPDLRRSAGR
jgi:dihydroorotase